MYINDIRSRKKVEPWTRNETRSNFIGSLTETENEFGGTVPFGRGGTERNLRLGGNINVYSINIQQDKVRESCYISSASVTLEISIAMVIGTKDSFPPRSRWSGHSCSYSMYWSFSYIQLTFCSQSS